MKRNHDLAALIERHRALETIIQKSRASFLSDWNCDNPFLEDLLGTRLFDLTSVTSSPSSYIYFDEEPSVISAILKLHLDRELLQLSPANVVAGPGSSSLLTAFSLWLRRSGYKSVYYLPPIYHTLHFLLDTLDIDVAPVSITHAFEHDQVLDLPSRRTVLLLCDPIWYAGRVMPIEKVEQIASWQRATGSLVFVDGSFQFMRWDGTRSEGTSQLDPELTFRLVCPAKALAVPFFRFAYLLHPSNAHSDIVFLYESIVGGSSASDLAFAARALKILNSEAASSVMANLFKYIYSRLTQLRLIRTTITPECGYFVFAVPLAKLPGQVTMGQEYFELKGYPGYCRINLLAARRIYSLQGNEERMALGNLKA